MKSIITILFAAITTMASAQIRQQTTTPTPPEKTLLIFKSPEKARKWTALLGYTCIGIGGALAGKAEMQSRYHGTTGNFDSYHLTRDAGLLLSGLGGAAIGANLALCEKPNWIEFGGKLLFGALLYRVSAETTYNLTKPK